MKNKWILPSFVRSSSLWHTCRCPPVHSGIIRVQFISFIIYSKAAVIIFQSIGLWLEAFWLGAVQVNVATHWHLRLGHWTVVIPSAWQSEATIIWPVTVSWHVRIARTVVDTTRQAAVVIR